MILHPDLPRNLGDADRFLLQQLFARSKRRKLTYCAGAYPTKFLK